MPSLDLYKDHSPIREYIHRIHKQPQQCVYEFTGAGSQALYQLHEVAGSSATILEANDRYAYKAVDDVCGFAPERYCSEEVARALADHAFKRALSLRDSKDTPVFGVGLSASIASERPKRGLHQAYLAISNPLGVECQHLVLAKGQRTRQEEEALLSAWIIMAMARASGIYPKYSPISRDDGLTVQSYPSDILKRFFAREVSLLRYEQSQCDSSVVQLT